MEPLPNHRFKLPMYLVLTVVCAVLIVVRHEVLLWSIFTLVGVVSVAMIATGRNPWWTRSALDRRAQRVRRR
jgi:hypothetical protein